jgi:hypothetical protein
MSNPQKYIPFVVGNTGIVVSLAWLGTSELGLGGLMSVGLIAMLLYNGCLFIGRKLPESRSRRE